MFAIPLRTAHESAHSRISGAEREGMGRIERGGKDGRKKGRAVAMSDLVWSESCQHGHDVGGRERTRDVMRTGAAARAGTRVRAQGLVILVGRHGTPGKRIDAPRAHGPDS